ncbi:MAG TPA: hypothetical protein PL110_15770 [Candidatus Eremiobacteraeota bacterium]|nr:MAG: hypothetical protein BWY64_01550 [bacterium ADurb.Bin363]HPZ09560.1 hypothetical protein [Candidatus Eremiobacteraeota bacterium]
MKKTKENRGMALITVLMTMIILLMLTVALVTINSNNLLYSFNYNSRVGALMAAESGVAYAIYELQENENWQPSELVHATSAGKFTIKFTDGTNKPPYFSYNNLTSPFPLTGAGYKNSDIAENSVDLIVTGKAGNTSRHIRVTLGRLTIGECGRFSGIANIMAGKFTIKRSPTAKDLSEGGSLHSNFKNVLDPNEPGIDTHSTEVYAYGGVISSTGGLNVPQYDSGNNTELRSGVQPRPVPDLDIKKVVASARGKQGVSSVSGGVYEVKQDTAGGEFNLYLYGQPATIPGTRIESNGQIVFTKDVYFQSDVIFKFPMKDNYYKEAGVILEKTGTTCPSIYVNGTSRDTTSFWVLGKVEGNGSIYNTGSTKFIMQTDLVASEESGAALLSEGDINVSLPASRLNPISLNLTGAILTHGNLKTTILDPNSPDNPHIALGDDAWPDEWVEMAYSNFVRKYGTGSKDINGDMKIDLPCAPPLNKDNPNDKWYMKFLPTTDLYKDEKNVGNSSITLVAHGDGVFSWTGPASGVEVNFYKNDLVVTPKNDDIDIKTPGTFVDTTLPSAWFPENAQIAIDGVEYNNSSSRAKLYTFMYNAINREYGGFDDSSSTTAIQGEVYPPNVRITGALLVADPNNLDGSGVFTDRAGNINVNLVSNKGRGDFTIIHSKNYEKLLALPELNSGLVVKTWEEVR